MTGVLVPDSAVHNVGQLLSGAARRWPNHAAVAEPGPRLSWHSLSYAELETDCNRIASGLVSGGVTPGMRIALLVPAGINFVSLVFALFKTGAVVILIDPGIGRRNLVTCLAESRPQGFVGIAKAQIARWLFRHRFPDARFNFIVGRNHWPGCRSVEKFRQRANDDFQIPVAKPTNPAAIIFTSGSTGPPKGVLYEHGNFLKQAEEIRDYFEIEPGGADVSGFPLFALFNTAMGKTTVFPRMNFSRPAAIDPREMIRAAEDWRADQSFGSPALWNTVSLWCEQTGNRLSGIRRVMSAGAPVPAHVLNRVKKIIAPEGEVYTPYGATEALPVACNSASIVMRQTAAKTDAGDGVCVGGRFPGIRWRVIAVTDEPIASIDQTQEQETGEIGELIVRGPVVTRQYVTRIEANALSKIADGDSWWHRMGDVGYLDEHQRFWFCGRKSQRVITERGSLYTIPCESIINTHPAIYRSALVGMGPRGSQSPAIVAEPWPKFWPHTKSRQQRLIKELIDLAAQHDKTRAIRRVFLRRKLPVDIRHNAKIFREKLAIWAASRI